MEESVLLGGVHIAGGVALGGSADSRQVDSVSRQKQELTEEALNKLLDQLHPERSEAGEKYEKIRRKLVQFFFWERAEFPEEHADEALNRVARKLAGGEPIVDVERYIYGAARMISPAGGRQR